MADVGTRGEGVHDGTEALLPAPGEVRVSGARREGVGVGFGACDGQGAAGGQQGVGDGVGGEEVAGGEPTGVRQRGQCGGECDARGEAHGALEGGGDDDGQADALGKVQARSHAPERLDLENNDVGGVRLAHPQRVLGAADRLVGGDGHVDRAA